MADQCAVYTVGGMTINATTGDTIILSQPPDGLDAVDLRRTIWPQGQGDGAILGTSKKQHRVVTFTGFELIRSVPNPFTDMAGFEAASQALEDAWIAAIDALENADGTLAWSSHSLTVRKNLGPKFGAGAQDPKVIGKTFLLTLVAANPAIA